MQQSLSGGFFETTPIYGGDRMSINRTKIRVFPSFVGLSTDFPKLSTGLVILNKYSFLLIAYIWDA